MVSQSVSEWLTSNPSPLDLPKPQQVVGVRGVFTVLQCMWRWVLKSLRSVAINTSPWRPHVEATSCVSFSRLDLWNAWGIIGEGLSCHTKLCISIPGLLGSRCWFCLAWVSTTNRREIPCYVRRLVLNKPCDVSKNVLEHVRNVGELLIYIYNHESFWVLFKFYSTTSSLFHRESLTPIACIATWLPSSFPKESWLGSPSNLALGSSCGCVGFGAGEWCLGCRWCWCVGSTR